MTAAGLGRSPASDPQPRRIHHEKAKPMPTPKPYTGRTVDPRPTTRHGHPTLPDCECTVQTELILDASRWPVFHIAAIQQTHLAAQRTPAEWEATGIQPLTAHGLDPDALPRD